MTAIAADMIANGTIIGSKRTQRERREDEYKTAQSVATMAVALQWHVATNANEPVALATSRSVETGVGEKDVLLVVCDTPQAQGGSARTAAELARSILDAYHAREAQLAAPNGVNGSRAPGERADVAQWLADAITVGLRRMYKPTFTVSPTSTAQLSDSSIVPAQSTLADPSISATATQTINSAVYATAHSVVAAVIHHDTLYVSRYGGGQVYLLRNGVLQHLTDASFAGGANPALLEPDLGQLDLSGEDRVVLCNEAFGAAINETQLRSVLRATPSSRRATQILLDTAVRDHEGKVFSLALADYVTGRPGVFPNTPTVKAKGNGASGVRRGTFRSMAAIAALLLLIASAIFAVMSLSGGRIFSGASGGNTTPVSTGAPTVAPTLNAVVPITPTVTTEATVSTKSTETTAPTTPPTTAPATATQTVEPSATASPVPTDTPEPTVTNTPEPTPTRRPTRRPPTATPVPTDTPIPPTATLAPTDTPTPQPSGGGGGGGGQPQPPPQCTTGQAGCLP